MKKIFFVFLIPLLIILVSNVIIASRPAPVPVCYIKGIIQSVDFKEAYNESCQVGLCGPEGCCIEGTIPHGATYYLNVTIKEVSYLNGTTEYTNCEKLFPINRDKTFLIGKQRVKSSDIFEINQKIEGQIDDFWADTFVSYRLEKLEDSDVREWIYPAIVLMIVVGIVVLIYFLRKNKR